MSYHSFIVGRNPMASPGDISIQVSDFKNVVSSRHCKIIYDNGTFFIEDLNSVNKTYIDGVAIHDRIPIHKNSRITLGKKFVFSLNHPIIQKKISSDFTVPVSRLSIQNYAEWGTRFGAHFLDNLFFNLLISPLSALSIFLFNLWDQTKELSLLIIAILVIVAGLSFGLHFYFALPISKSGQTWGKKILNLKVLDEISTKLPSQTQVWGRYLTVFIMAYSLVFGVVLTITHSNFYWIIPGLLLTVNFFMPLWTKKRQCLHDMMVNTIVIKAHS